MECTVIWLQSKFATDTMLAHMAWSNCYLNKCPCCSLLCMKLSGYPMWVPCNDEGNVVIGVAAVGYAGVSTVAVVAVGGLPAGVCDLNQGRVDVV